MGLDLNKKTYFLISGASRGIGRRMAIGVSSKLKTNSVVALLARNKKLLEETKIEIENTRKEQLQVITYTIDLEKAEAHDFIKILQESLSTTNETANNFERAFIIHNAGTIGDVSKRASDVADTNVWKNYFHTNLFSTIALNCEFLKLFSSISKLVVNLSSKCGIEPFSSMAYYCTAKAARDMYFRVLATEDESSLILNYAPGAIDTDMTVFVQQQSVNKDLVESFRQQRETKTMLTVEQTTNKFLQILQETNFTSGAHIDYWD